MYRSSACASVARTVRRSGESGRTSSCLKADSASSFAERALRYRDSASEPVRAASSDGR